MEYFKLVLGIMLIVGFAWILANNSKRSGFVNALLRIDTLTIIIVDLYLVFTSVNSLLF